MEEQKDGKKKKALWIILPILAAALVAGGIILLTQLGKKGPVEPEMGDYPIYYNEDKDFYYQMTEGGMSGREKEEDGLYHFLLCYDGEELEYTVDVFKLVNLIDNWDLCCFDFDEETKTIKAMKRPEDCGYTLMMQDVYVVETQDDGTIIYNVQESLDGIEAPYTPGENVKFINLMEKAKVVEDYAAVLQKGDRITVYEKDGVEYVYLFPRKGDIHGRIYWNVTRMWDSELLATSRKPDADGYYVFELSCDGEVKTYKTKSRDVATAMDNRAARCFSLRFNKKGEIVKFVSPDAECGNSSIASWHTVINFLDDNGSFHAKKLASTAKDYLNEEDIMFTENTVCYCVNDNFDDHYGEVTQPKIGDTVHCLRNADGEIVIVFIVGRKLSADMYWNVDRQYDSTKKATKRTPGADGYYHIKMTTNGNQPVDLRTKDVTLINSIESKGGKHCGLILDSDGKTILKVITSTSVAGIGDSTASWTDVVTLDGTHFVSHKAEGSGTTYDGQDFDIKYNDKTQFLNVSGTGSFVGEKTKLQVGDRVHVLTDLEGYAKIVYIVDRRENADIYWNCERMWDSRNSTSSRKPAADGYYHIMMTTGGKAPVDLITKDKSLVDKIDGVASKHCGLQLNGNVITKYVKTSSVNGIVSSTASWTEVTALKSNGFKSHKKENAGTTYDGQDFDITYTSAYTQIYNVSGVGVPYIGAPDSVQINDTVHVVTGKNNAAKIVFIVSRPINADIYWNLERKYNSTDKVTTRTPDANGYYTYQVTTGGKAPITVQTKDKDIANSIDKYAARNMGLVLDKDGKTVTKVYDTVSVIGYTGSSTASWTNVTKINANGFVSHKPEDAGTSYDGKDFTITYTANTKVYCVNDNFDDHYGEETKVRLGDIVHVERDGKGNPAIVFVVTRKKMEVALDKADLTLRKEQESKLNVSVTPAEMKELVKWTSSDEDVVKVDQNGNLVAGTKEGTATITVQLEDKKATTTVTVAGEPVKITALTLDETSYELSVGGGLKLPVKFTPEEASYQKLAYETSDSTIATVDADGNVTALKLGTVTITAKDPKGSASVSATINISTHEHCICGTDTLDVEGHSHSVPKWEAWTASDSLPVKAANSGKYYYLTQNVILSAGLTVENVNVTICLNGHTVESKTHRILSLQKQATVNITDCANGVMKAADVAGSGAIYLKEQSTVNFYNGTLDVSAHSLSGYGLGFYLYDSQNVVNFYNGTVLGGKTSNQGCCAYIGNTDKMNIYGGTFKGNAITGNYSGTINVGTNGTLNIYGGTIKDGSAQSGGNISVGNQSVVNMYGGTITGGKANKEGSNGGFGGNVSIRKNGTFNMYGGTIENGVANGSNGGNVSMYEADAHFNMYGGTITGGSATTVSTSGGLGIFYNAAGDCVNLIGGTITGNKGGVHVEKGAWVTLGNVKILDNENSDLFCVPAQMKADASLASAEETIGYSNALGVDFLPADKDYSKAFKLNDDKYKVVYDATNKIHTFGIQISEHKDDTKHCLCGGSAIGTAGHTCKDETWTKWDSTTALPATTGFYYLTEDIDLGNTAAAITGDVAICMNGHTVTGSKKASVTGSIVLTDCTATVVNGIDQKGTVVLEVSGPTDDLMFTEGANVTVYDVKNTNTDKQSVVDILNPEDAANMKIDIYLIAGQSNAAGSTTLASASSTDRDYNVYNNVSYYYVRRNTDGTFAQNFDQYVPVKEGLSNSTGTYIGPELGMAKALNEQYAGSDKQAIILKSAAGGTSILYHQDESGNMVYGKDDGTFVTVDPDGTKGSDGKNNYERNNERGTWYPAVNETNGDTNPSRYTGFLCREFGVNVKNVYEQLLNLGYKAENINFVALNWMQGETDRTAPKTYAAEINKVFDELKGYVSAATGKDYSKLPIVVGEISETFSSATTSNVEANQKFVAMQDNLVFSVPNCVVIPSRTYAVNKLVDGKSVPCGTDESHWNYKDAEEVGVLFGEASLAMANGEYTHEHCACGTGSSVGNHTTHKNVTFIPWNRTDILPLGGAYYLTEDVKLTKMPTLWNSDLYLCLNGHTITTEGTFRLFRGNDSCNFVVTDCQSTAGTITVNTNGYTGYAGCFASLDKGSTMSVYNVTVDCAKAENTYGAVVYQNDSNTTFNAYRATIIGGTATGSKNTDGTLKKDGRGTVLFAMKTDKVHLYKTEVTFGTSTSYAGIYYSGSDMVAEDCTFNGGKSSEGDQIFLTGASNVNFKNCSFAGAQGSIAFEAYNSKVTLEGLIKFTGNKSKNLYVSSGSTLELGPSGLAAGSDVKVSILQGKFFFHSDTDYSAMVTSDSGETVTYDTTEKALILKEAAAHVHCDCVGLGPIGDHKSCTDATWTRVTTEAGLKAVMKTATAKTDVYAYLGTDITLSANLKPLANNVLHICLNGHTLKGANNTRVLSTYNVANGGFVLTDCSSDHSGVLQCQGKVAALQGQALMLYNDQGAATTFEMYGGTIKDGHNTDHYGANIIVYGSGAVMKMYGGTIENGQAERPAGSTSTSHGRGGNIAIDNKATCYLFGGTVKGGKATVCGQNIYNNANLYIGGKFVCDDTSDNVYVTANGKVYEAEGGFKTGASVKFTLASGVTEILASDKSLLDYVSADGDNTLTYDATKKIHVMKAGHIHCICGGVGTIGTHTLCTDKQWAPVGTAAELKTAVGTAASATTDVYVYITKDIALTGSISIGKNVHAFICLNGHTITAASNARAFVVNGNGTAGFNAELSVCDCSKNETGVITANEATTKSSYSGGNILVYTEGVFNLYGGTIQNGKPAEHGGNVSVQGGKDANVPKAVFNMYGGTIKDGAPAQEAGNIMVNRGTMNMYGGTISGGKAATYAGNIEVYAGKLYMKGGVIRDGLSTNNGGNLLVSGTNSEFTMDGGTISGGKLNGGTITRYGANICMSGTSTFTINDGIIENGASYSSTDTKTCGGNFAMISDVAKAVINGGTFRGGNCYAGGHIAAIGKGSITINGGTFENGSTTMNGFNIYQTQGTVTITGGTFKAAATGSKGQGVDLTGASGIMNISGGSYDCYVTAIHGKMTISGGTFSGTVGPVLPDNTDYTMTLTGGKYVSKPGAKCTLPEEYGYTDISETIGGKTYKYQIIKK